jgi:hypothetical protein
MHFWTSVVGEKKHIDVRPEECSIERCRVCRSGRPTTHPPHARRSPVSPRAAPPIRRDPPVLANPYELVADDRRCRIGSILAAAGAVSATVLLTPSAAAQTGDGEVGPAVGDPTFGGFVQSSVLDGLVASTGSAGRSGPVAGAALPPPGDAGSPVATGMVREVLAAVTGPAAGSGPADAAQPPGIVPEVVLPEVAVPEVVVPDVVVPGPVVAEVVVPDVVVPGPVVAEAMVAEAVVAEAVVAEAVVPGPVVPAQEVLGPEPIVEQPHGVSGAPPTDPDTAGAWTLPEHRFPAWERLPAGEPTTPAPSTRDGAAAVGGAAGDRTDAGPVSGTGPAADGAGAADPGQHGWGLGETAAVGVAGLVGQQAWDAVRGAVGKGPEVTASRVAKGATAAAVEQALTPRQQRALSALNRDPLGTLRHADEFVATMGDVGRNLLEKVGGEVGYGLVNTGLTAAAAPLGPAGQVAAAAVAKVAQKDHIAPWVHRQLAPDPASAVLAGPTGEPYRAPADRPDLVDVLGDRITSSPVDRMLTTVDGRPLTAREATLVRPDGAPLAAPNAVERIVSRVSDRRSGPVVAGADGRPLTGSAGVLAAGPAAVRVADGGVLVPTTIYADPTLREFLDTPGRTQRSALAELGVPTQGDLSTRTPAAVDTRAVEQRAVDATVDAARLRMAADGVVGLPAELADLRVRSTTGAPAPRPVVSGGAAAAAAGESAKQAGRLALATAGVPASASDALGAIAGTCAGAVCSSLGKAVEDVVRGRAPAAATLRNAAVADGVGGLARALVTLSPDEALTLAATTGGGYLAGTLDVSPALRQQGTGSPAPRASSPAADVAAPRGRAAAGVGALVAGIAAPMVEGGLRSAGILPVDPLNAGWQAQTANVVARTVTGCLTGLSSRADCVTGAATEASNAFFDETTAGLRARRFAESEYRGDPVRERLEAAGSVPINALRQVGTAGTVTGAAFETTGQLVGTGLAIAWDAVNGGSMMPVEDYLRNLDEMSGPQGTRAALEDGLTTAGRILRRTGQVFTGVPEAVCDAAAWVRCPGSPGHPAGEPRLGPRIVGAGVPGHPEYASLVARGLAGDQSRPGMSGYGAGPAGIGYVGDGSGTPEDRFRTGFANVASRPQEVVSRVVNDAVDAVVRDPVGAVLRGAVMLAGH